MHLNNLNTKILGKKYFYYDEIDSTQKEIWRLYEKNIDNGTLVIADIQTNATGTHGRKWYTERKNNIAFSLYLKMNCTIKQIENLTFEIAQIITTIFKEIYNINLIIKKPNDIIFNNKKICGILTQTKLINENVKDLVIGIGINTSQMQFNDEIKEIATSIKKEFNIDVNIPNFIKVFCEKFETIINERIER